MADTWIQILERLEQSEADAYWKYQSCRVYRIAFQLGIEITLRSHDDDFLYDLFDNGEADRTDDEIAEAIKEYALDDMYMNFK